MSVFCLHKEMLIPSSIEEVWEFISSPANLKKITPASMGFDIIGSKPPDKMYAGMIIIYKVRPFAGIPIRWVTEISHLRDKEYFVDEQRLGPYSMWHHQHLIEEVDGGIRMRDIITYKLPFGILGRLANALFVRRKLENIFLYREKALNEIFPGEKHS